MQYLKTLLLIVGVSSLVACGERSVSPKGYEYVHHIHTNGKTPVQGDQILFHVDLLHGNRTVHSSRQQAEPAEMRMRATHQMTSPIEEALSRMSKGDSMTVFVKIDTLYPQVELSAQRKEIAYHLSVLDIIPQAGEIQTASR